jgi:S-adenosylmethionine:tRNA ribosyltransferase-isomerase
MHPKELSIKSYTYELPEWKIARYPLEKRDESKLLIYHQGNISESRYKHIADHLEENSLLIFNNTKVVEARLLFQKSTGGWIEIFCLEPHSSYPDINIAMQTKTAVKWNCLVGGANKWKQGVLQKSININGNLLTLSAEKIKQQGENFEIGFSWTNTHLSFAEVLHLFGEIPIPPYLERKSEETDKERYQTIYAKKDGSVAAPTAGLHFTDHIFNELDKKKITREFVTLHVGAGTFKPVKAEKIKDHEMHAEFIEVSNLLLEKIISHKNDLICVGTTSLRTIESLYWMGVLASEQSKVKTENNISIEDLSVKQWDPYQLPSSLTKEEALNTLLSWMRANRITKLICKTQIIIAPGYQLRVANGLITNFHQPQSTLLLLVAAVAGQHWRKIYDYALENNFRFLSYGDGSLIKI